MHGLPETGNFFVQLGEHEGIGASSGLLSYSGKKFLLDAGTSFKKVKGIPIQQVLLPTGNGMAGERIDLIMCSHTHLDHSGFLPHVVAIHPEAIVIISRQCFLELKVMFPDAHKISTEEANKASCLGFEPSNCPFNFEEMEAFFGLEGTSRLRLIDTPCEFDDLPGLAGWRFKFSSSGHTIGAFSTFVESPDHMTFYWTGDVASHDQEICSGVLVPEGWETPDVLITEATYGAMPAKETRAQTWERFAEIVFRTHAKHGHVLCPAFAVNRLSNVASKSTELSAKAGFLTVVDGLAAKGNPGERIIDIELGERKVEQLINEGFLLLINQADKSIGMSQRKMVLDGEYGPAVIISSSATMENGWSSFWAKNLLPERKNAVILTGYVFPDSIAEQVLQKGRNIVLEYYNKKWNKMIKQPVNCACEVYSLSLSAHDYQQGLVNRVVVARPKLLVVHHTSDASFTAYVEALKSEFERRGFKLPRIVRGRHMNVIDL